MHRPGRCSVPHCSYAARPGSRYCSPTCEGLAHGQQYGQQPSPRAVSPLRTGRGGGGTPASQAAPPRQTPRGSATPAAAAAAGSGAAQPSPARALPPSRDFGVSCIPLDAGLEHTSEATVGVLHADPMAPLCFSLQGCGASVRVRMPSGEVKTWELPLEDSRGGAASPAEGGSTGMGGLFGSLFSAMGSGGGGGGSASASASGRKRRHPALPLRVEVSLSARTRRVTVRLGSVLDPASPAIAWAPALFQAHRYGASRGEEEAAASLAGWGARARELAASIDAQLCDQPRVAPLLALLAATQGSLHWEVRRLAAQRRGLLDEIKALMEVYAAAASVQEEEEEEGGGGGGAGSAGSAGSASPPSAATRAEVARLSAELGKLRDEVGALTLRAGGREGGEAPTPPDIANGGAHEPLAAAYREALHNAQRCSAHAAGEEASEAEQQAAGARGRGYGLHLQLDLPSAPAAVGALRAECAALYAAARMAGREKAEGLKAHFSATTPRSRIEGLPRWVQDALECTGRVVFAALGQMAIERSDGIPLLT